MSKAKPAIIVYNMLDVQGRQKFLAGVLAYQTLVKQKKAPEELQIIVVATSRDHKRTAKALLRKQWPSATIVTMTGEEYLQMLKEKTDGSENIH